MSSTSDIPSADKDASLKATSLAPGKSKTSILQKSSEFLSINPANGAGSRRSSVSFLGADGMLKTGIDNLLGKSRNDDYQVVDIPPNDIDDDVVKNPIAKPKESFSLFKQDSSDSDLNKVDGDASAKESNIQTNLDEENKDKVDPASFKQGELGGVISASQFTNNSSSNSRFPNSREISETFVTKTKEMIVCGISLVANGLLLYFFVQLKHGMNFPLGVDDVTHIGAVIVEILLLIANVITLVAMDDGVAAYFGSRLCSKQGYSLAICGFQQTSPFLKIPYCSQLSLNSTCRKLLTKLAILWFLLEFLKVLSPVPATAIRASTSRVDKGTVNCILFGQDKSPVDRGWPTVEVEAGIAELIFGTYIGYVRSERADISVTTAIMSPQIVAAVNDGDTIVGDGFTTDIFTKCSCTNGNTVDHIVGLISDSDLTSAQTLLNEYNTLDKKDGVASYIQEQPNNNRTVVTSILSGSKVCGGSNGTLLNVCTTVFNNHNQATIMVTYMTDGTPASIAGKASEIREVGAPGNLTWMTQALLNIHDGKAFSSYRLPNNFPGALTPLLWWTTPNLLSTDPSLLDAGVETYFAILLRAGMQRTFSIRGNTCIRNIELVGSSFVTMESYGVTVAIIILVIQLVATAASIAAFYPWFISNSPIGPGVRIVRENIYFMTLLNSSGFVQGFNELCNAPAHSIWQTLDVIAKIGESLSTKAEVMGHITMDKPKLVRSLTNGKKYY